MGSRGFGRARVLKDLLRIHHRVHRGVGLGVLRLGAEAAVLGTAARFRVDQRAHIGRVGKAVTPHVPRTLDEGFDLGVILELAELERFLAGDKWRHPADTVGAAPDEFGRRIAACQAAFDGSSLPGAYCPAQPIGREQEGGEVSEVEAHITGTVWKIEVAVGDSVHEGDTVVILESMKMEMPVEAEDEGVVTEILCEEGQSVAEGDALVVLE